MERMNRTSQLRHVPCKDPSVINAENLIPFFYEALGPNKLCAALACQGSKPAGRIYLNLLYPPLPSLDGLSMPSNKFPIYIV
jgi:hypothetical protein